MNESNRLLIFLLFPALTIGLWIFSGRPQNPGGIERSAPTHKMPNPVTRTGPPTPIPVPKFERIENGIKSKTRCIDFFRRHFPGMRFEQAQFDENTLQASHKDLLFCLEGPNDKLMEAYAEFDIDYDDIDPFSSVRLALYLPRFFGDSCLEWFDEQMNQAAKNKTQDLSTERQIDGYIWKYTYSYKTHENLPGESFVSAQFAVINKAP